MNILFLTLGDERIASSRIRAWQFARELAATGQEVNVAVGADAKSVATLLRKKWDVCVIQKWIPPRWYMTLIRLRSDIVIYDCDDAIMLSTSMHPPGSLEIAQRNRTRLLSVVGEFDGITVSTGVLARDFHNISGGCPLLTFTGPAPAPVLPGDAKRNGMLWLGSPATESYVWDLIERLPESLKNEGLNVVGSKLQESPDPRIQLTPWTSENQRHALADAAIGIFVQPEGEWESRKSGYKILEYIAAGLIPVAQTTAASVEILGRQYPYLVDENKSWDSIISAVSQLSKEERKETVAGLQARIDEFSYQNSVSRWLSFVKTVALSKSAPDNEV